MKNILIIYFLLIVPVLRLEAQRGIGMCACNDPDRHGCNRNKTETQSPGRNLQQQGINQQRQATYEREQQQRRENDAAQQRLRDQQQAARQRWEDAELQRTEQKLRELENQIEQERRAIEQDKLQNTIIINNTAAETMSMETTTTNYIRSLNEKTKNHSANVNIGLQSRLNEERNSTDQSALQIMNEEVSSLNDLEFETKEAEVWDKEEQIESLSDNQPVFYKGTLSEIAATAVVRDILKLGDNTVNEIFEYSSFIPDITDENPESIAEIVFQESNPLVIKSSEYAIRSGIGTNDILSATNNDIREIILEDELNAQSLNDDIFTKVNPIEFARQDYGLKNTSAYKPLTTKEMAGIVIIGAAASATVALPVACLFAAAYGFNR
jgi:hypothetical protein